jgi:hypothetical protein
VAQIASILENDMTSFVSKKYSLLGVILLLSSVIFISNSSSQEQCKVKKSKTGTQMYVEEDLYMSMLTDGLQDRSSGYYDALKSQGIIKFIKSGTIVTIKEKHSTGDKYAYAEVIEKGNPKSFYMYLSSLDLPKQLSHKATIRKETLTKYIVKETNTGAVPITAIKDALSAIILAYRLNDSDMYGRFLSSGNYYLINSGAIGIKMDEDIVDGVPIIQLKFKDGYIGWTLEAYLRKLN